MVTTLLAASGIALVMLASKEQVLEITIVQARNESMEISDFRYLMIFSSKLVVKPKAIANYIKPAAAAAGITKTIGWHTSGAP